MSTLSISTPGALNEVNLHQIQIQNGIIAGVRMSSSTHPAMISGLNAELERNSTSPSQKKHHVVVVGAGISGLRCAAVLQRHGVGVTVLEGRDDRIGGRILTSRKHGRAARDIGKYYL